MWRIECTVQSTAVDVLNTRLPLQSVIYHLYLHANGKRAVLFPNEACRLFLYLHILPHMLLMIDGDSMRHSNDFYFFRINFFISPR